MFLAANQVALCLDCFVKFSQVHQASLENLERAINWTYRQAYDVVGLGDEAPQFPPRPRPVVLGGVKMNNINVSNSVVGTINTGTIGHVDQSISALKQSGQNDLARAVKELTEGVLQSKDLDQEQRIQLLETLSIVSAEAIAPKEQRRSSVAKALLDNASKMTGLAKDLTEIGSTWWPILLTAFGS